MTSKLLVTVLTGKVVRDLFGAEGDTEMFFGR
jgi:hypothetical protein